MSDPKTITLSPDEWQYVVAAVLVQMRADRREVARLPAWTFDDFLMGQINLGAKTLGALNTEPGADEQAVLLAALDMYATETAKYAYITERSRDAVRTCEWRFKSGVAKGLLARMGAK